MTQTILRLPDVKARTGLSRSTIYLLISRQKFPAPRALGERAVGWEETAVAEWIGSRPLKVPTGRKAA